MGLSIGLHFLIFLAGYYIKLNQAVSISTGYTITLAAAAKQTTVATSRKKTTQSKKTSRKKKTQPQKKPKLSTTAKPQKSKPVQKNAVEQHKIVDPKPVFQQQEESTLDERGLYKSQHGQQTGAKLDLAGWMWDNAPKPNDDTDESGKIIFEIKIDEFGEVIAVKTLEKTTSPLVEKLYKDALTALTFSRTTDNVAYAPVYAGKVTFILRTK